MILAFIFQEAVKYGQRVACLDFVKPSPLGTAWGLYSLFCILAVGVFGRHFDMYELKTEIKLEMCCT
jgi:hypothetical protein